MKVIEQDPALAAAGSRLTCVVGVSGVPGPGAEDRVDMHNLSAPFTQDGPNGALGVPYNLAASRGMSPPGTAPSPAT